MPFVHYLTTSIKAHENKEIRCRWSAVANARYSVIPDKRIWRYSPESRVRIVNESKDWYEILREANGDALDEQFAPQISDSVIAGKGADRVTFALADDHYRCHNNRYEIYLPDLGARSVVQWSGYNLTIRASVPELNSIEFVHVDGYRCKVTAVDEDCLTIGGAVTERSQLSIAGNDTAFQLISTSESAFGTLKTREEGGTVLVFSMQRPVAVGGTVEDCTDKLLSDLNVAHLQHLGKPLNPDRWILSYQEKTLMLECASECALLQGNAISCDSYPEIGFSIGRRDVDEKWIQLIEIADGPDTGKSNLDYFFSDERNIKILDSTQKRNDDGYRILRTRPDERQLLLARNSRIKNNRSSVYPSDADARAEICVSVNTSQLKRQKEAINRLKNRPAAGHLPLVKLLQDNENIQWSNVTPVQESSVEWQVLTKQEFSGCERQREFVCKALATPDFAILDGPPGTGKTTCILELIAQLSIEGKRVLLTASTHAAINNVLERIQLDSALSQRIFPLRIGSEGNAIGVEEYQFDALFKQLNSSPVEQLVSKQLMVDSSNLVCGTTIGILRLFREQEIKLDTGEPPFDVMIIDECSKTTFQEFLVPALYARRWVLVGDVRQLSPFTDRNQIVTNLDNLMLSPPRGKIPEVTMCPELQEACFLLEKLRGDNNNPYQHGLVVPVTDGVLQALQKEVAARARNSKVFVAQQEQFLFIRNSKSATANSDSTVTVADLIEAPWIFFRCTLCFIDLEALPALESQIPDDMIVIHPSWHRSPHAFFHENNKRFWPGFRVKNQSYEKSKEVYCNVSDQLGQSKWSEEICWRLERDYWLRQAKTKTSFYQKKIKRLLPESVKAEGRIAELTNIAFPSILEALSGGGLSNTGQHSRHTTSDTTLNQGFCDSEKQNRHVSLNYQHRMHPQISSFPRKEFYAVGELNDGSQVATDRVWGYERYNNRSSWVNVEGKTEGNSNQIEAVAVVAEVTAFCDWAERKNANRGKAYDVAILTFYKKQESALRKLLKRLPDNRCRYSRFNYKGISIKLATVDYFQGQEADIVFLSMVNTSRDGFMDSPNRLNVSITRARYQLAVIGHYDYFSRNSRSEELRRLANACEVINPIDPTDSKRNRHRSKSK